MKVFVLRVSGISLLFFLFRYYSSLQSTHKAALIIIKKDTPTGAEDMSDENNTNSLSINDIVSELDREETNIVISKEIKSFNKLTTVVRGLEKRKASWWACCVKVSTQ